MSADPAEPLAEAATDGLARGGAIGALTDLLPG